jgi:hypothetical protein
MGGTGRSAAAAPAAISDRTRGWETRAGTSGAPGDSVAAPVRARNGGGHGRKPHWRRGDRFTDNARHL